MSYAFYDDVYSPVLEGRADRIVVIAGGHEELGDLSILAKLMGIEECVDRLVFEFPYGYLDDLELISVFPNYTPDSNHPVIRRRIYKTDILAFFAGFVHEGDRIGENENYCLGSRNLSCDTFGQLKELQKRDFFERGYQLKNTIKDFIDRFGFDRLNSTSPEYFLKIFMPKLSIGEIGCHLSLKKQILKES